MTKRKLNAFSGTLALSVAMMASVGPARADIFSWTFGGGTDPVSGTGTLNAVVDPAIAGAFDITGGAGTVTDQNGTWNVTFLTIGAGGGNSGLCSSVWGEGWAGTAQCGTLAEPPGSGGADYPFDNLIYPNALPTNSVVDANGIVLYNAAGPQAETYFDVWSAANRGNPLPDQFEWSDLNPWAEGSSVNLANPFSVTDETVTSDAAAPEPRFYGVLGLGLAGVIAVVRRRKIV